MTAKATVVLAPAAMVTVRGLSSLTWQFAATPLKPTTWLPGVRPVSVTAALTPSGPRSTPSSVTV